MSLTWWTGSPKVPHSNSTSLPTLSRQELGEALWTCTPRALEARWGAALQLSPASAGVVRLQGRFTLGDRPSAWDLCWTFEDERLVLLRLSPEAGREAMDEGLRWLGVTTDRLSPIGDGLLTCEDANTRIDVDRLDGVISLLEVYP